MEERQDVSRVLSATGPCSVANHSTRSAIAGRSSIWDDRYRSPQAALKTGREKDQPLSLTLLPAGVYRASTSRCCWCALTAPLHPYRGRVSSIARRYFSVALSSRSLALGVTQQARSLGSPDFPQVAPIDLKHCQGNGLANRTTCNRLAYALHLYSLCPLLPVGVSCLLSQPLRATPPSRSR